MSICQFYDHTKLLLLTIFNYRTITKEKKKKIKTFFNVFVENSFFYRFFKYIFSVFFV